MLAILIALVAISLIGTLICVVASCLQDDWS